MRCRRRRLWIYVLLTQLLFGGCHEPHQINTQNIQRILSTPPQFPLRFVMLADIHMPFGIFTFSHLLHQIAMLDPPPLFIVVIGDAVDRGTIEEHEQYLDIIEPFPVPILTVIGNHELWVPEGRELYGRFYGEEDFSFSVEKQLFVALNDADPSFNGIRESQLQWLASQLTDGAFAEKFIFMHIPPPVLEPPWGPVPFANADRFYYLAETSQVSLIGLGHHHQYQHRQLGRVHYLAASGAGGYQSGIREYPPDLCHCRHFVLVTLEENGRHTVELIQQGEGVEPDPAYTFSFPSPVQRR